jgi:hypothetical protein
MPPRAASWRRPALPSIFSTAQATASAWKFTKRPR